MIYTIRNEKLKTEINSYGQNWHSIQTLMDVNIYGREIRSLERTGSESVPVYCKADQ